MWNEEERAWNPVETLNTSVSKVRRTARVADPVDALRSMNSRDRVHANIGFLTLIKPLALGVA